MTNFDRLDLNLLRVFRAVYLERSVLRAAKQLNLSHSAISHALRRLRDTIGDELFIRTGGGMVPTQRAHAIAPPIERALTLVQSVMGAPLFDPATAALSFTLAATDGVNDVLITRLSDLLSGIAPRVDLRIRPLTRLDLAEQLDVGRIDVAVGVFACVPPRFEARRLWSQVDVLVMRSEHPLAGKRISIDDLATYPLVTISVGGEGEGAVNGFIEERGLSRQSEMFDSERLMTAMQAAGRAAHVRVATPHTLAIPRLLRNTDMISILPRQWAEQLVGAHDLAIAPLPYQPRATDLQAVWRADRRHDQGLGWLISLLADLAADI